jgi:hypothetical protein
MESSNDEIHLTPDKKNRYTQILEHIFHKKYKKGDSEIYFDRDEIRETAKELGIDLPKNLGDLPYTFRYRSDLPESIRSLAPPDKGWVIWPAGRGRYRLGIAKNLIFKPSSQMAEIKVPDATPGIISKYTIGDEQSLLARMRYNRLVDIFTGVTSYSLQSHLRTTVEAIGQVETDEIYVGIDKRGAQFVFPIQAKAEDESLGVVQISQDLAMCQVKFPLLVCRPLGAQFIEDDLIAMFEFARQGSEIAVHVERHYRLVSYDKVTPEDLASYRVREE